MVKRKRRTQSSKRSKKRKTGTRLRRTIKQVIFKTLETKKHVVETGKEANTSILSSGLQYPLLSISQGDTAYTRDGDSINVSSVYGRIFFHNNTTLPVYVRMALISGTNATFDLASTELFEGVNDTHMTLTDARTAGFHVPVCAKWNHEAVKVFWAKTVKLEPLGLQRNAKMVPVKLRWGKKITYDGSASTTPVPPSDRMYLAMWAIDSTNDAAGGQVEVSGLFYVYFKDI